MVAPSFQVLVCGGLLVLCSIEALDNGLALTPPMGWLSWLRFGCNIDCDAKPTECISENLIKRTADLMVSEGYLAAGYEYITIDDCWLDKDRGPDGRLVPDPKRFPSGMKALADYVHSKGLKFGIYEDYGSSTCAGYPGVEGHEALDAETLASWDVDYIKLDGCNTDVRNMNKAYPAFGQLLNATGRPIVYACSWPYFLEVNHMKPNYTAVAEHCNVWRTWVDIRNSWASVVYTMNWMASNQQRLAPFAGPGHWNDPDMLVIGNSGLTVNQAKVQMAIWAILAAPLHMSVDLATIQPEFKAILLNRDIIAVNQDKLGKQGLRVWSETFSWRHKFQVWQRELSDNCYAIAIVYFGHHHTSSFFTHEELRIPRQNYLLQDLYNIETDRVLEAHKTLTFSMNGTDVKFYKFIPQAFDVFVKQI
ncbi:alpha-N-acetylgalactosaminidase-like [Anticarsia gemmatalis]|uniref:alpha-N-acetylgalactosaminidase-like n=1 Tax=Anticarsia gemmatalis TaxID=129554 RepID=UPI003F76313D